MTIFWWLLSIIVCYLVAYHKGRAAGVAEQHQWEREHTEIFK